MPLASSSPNDIIGDHREGTGHVERVLDSEHGDAQEDMASASTSSETPTTSWPSTSATGLGQRYLAQHLRIVARLQHHHRNALRAQPVQSRLGALVTLPGHVLMGPQRG